MAYQTLEFLRLNLYNSCLDSFGVKKQFIELEFSNPKFEEIKFFVDCNITAIDHEIDSIISQLRKFDDDTFVIAYFLKANLKCIISCDFDDENNLRLDFENDYSILFDLNKAPDSNLSITFKEKEDSKDYLAIDIYPDGEVNNNGKLT